MGKSCYLCKMMFIKGDTRRSFHKFPDAQYQKEAWCQSLKMDLKKVKGWTFICSDHFLPESFIYRLNRTRFLKHDAVPLFYKGPVRPRKPKRTKSDIKIDPDMVKAECESQENENRELDRNIKLEPPCSQEEDKNIFIKTEKDLEESPVGDNIKTESVFVKTEITEEFEIKEEGTFNLLPSNELKEEFKDSDIIHNIFGTSASNDISECEDEMINEQPYVESTPEKSSDSSIDLDARFKETYPKRGELYACVECAFQTPARSGIKKHFMVHRDAEFKANPELYRYKTHRCKECSYIAIQKYNLVRHMVKHLPADGLQVKVYSCDECGYFTKYRCDLVKHQSKHLNKERRFKCTKCSYGTNEGKHLREHLLKGHIEEKKYKYECEKCPYKTDCRGSLNRHIAASHSEMKKLKYECEKCSFKTNSKWSWNKHMKNHNVEKKQTPEENV